MRATKLMVSVACAAAFVLSAGQASANLLTNPGFETGDLTGWAALNTNAVATIAVQAPDNGPSAAGSHNAYLNNQGEAIGLVLAQTTPLGSATPGPVYYAYDLKTGPTALGGVFFVEIFAQNAAGAVIGNAGLQGNYTPANWTTFSGSFTAPAGTDHLTIQFEAVTGAVVGGSSAMHVDNVLLQQVVPTETSKSTWGKLKALYR
jgi:hypothetical protein